ncbi:MAG: beta-lactamase family protein [Candidatus Eremiobacteraeota bacterium]|nr:beta-lactamase family protein [Candidatus Eremiobacteraeota bacterium]MBC5822150.1 beta-lactamase family protein [Candidatus Eremiobacteraeota bacterium]
MLFACLCLAACGGGGSTPSPIPTAGVAGGGGSSIDQIVAAHYAGGWGVELAIYKNGTPLYVHGYGLRDRGLPDSFGGHDFWGVPQPDKFFNLPRGAFVPDAGTLFDLASVSKEFTAGAILLLQQDGKLSVNDPLSKYFPTLPNANGIPLLYLLQHRSGFVDYNSFGQYPDFSSAYSAFMAGGQTNYQPIVDLLSTFPLDFAPGTRYEYSNTNYLLLGLIVAKVAGEPLGLFLQQRIFSPLGMTQTHQGFPPPPLADLALGYADYGAGAQRTYQPNLQWLAGPGGLTSTVGDLERWDRGVRQPGIFTQASLTQMFTPGPFPQSYGTYADGWFIASLQGHPYIWHDGDVTGYQTMNATFPSDGIDIIILTNDGSGLDPYYIIPQLFPLALRM